MGALLKNPAYLIGAVVLGLLIFAGRKGGAGGDRLGAAIESQRISSGANVALSDITARRDVGMAQAWNDRAAIAAGSQLDFARAFNESTAIRLSHDEAVKSLAVSQALGTLQINSAREVALGEQSTMTRIATLDARSRDLATRTAGEIALGAQSTQISLANIGATAAHEEKLLTAHVAELGYMATRAGQEWQGQLAQMALSSPAVLAHIEALAQLDADKTASLATISGHTAESLATINAMNAQALATINAQTQAFGIQKAADSKSESGFIDLAKAAIPIVASFL